MGPSVGGKGRFRVTISQSLDVGRITLEEIASFLSEHGIRAYVLAHRHSKRLEKPHWRQVWNLWITEQQSIVWFIEGVFPFLRIKRQRAEDYRRVCLLYPSAKGLNSEGQSKITRAEFSSLIESGKSLTEIAREFKMDYSSVWMKAKRMGFAVASTEQSNRKRAKVPLETIVKLFEETGTYQETARRLKMPPWNVRNRLLKNGITPNEPNKTKGRQKGVHYEPIPLS